MSDFRDVPMSGKQAAILDEQVIPALMRSGDTEAASHMMALSLAWKFAPEQEPVLPANVVQIESRRVGA